MAPFLELTARGIHLNPGNTGALALKGHVPSTPKDISLLAAVGVCTADEGGIKVERVPVGADDFAIESTIGIVRDGGGGTARADAATIVPDKQAAKHIATGFMVRRTAYVEWMMDPKLSLPACRREANGAM